MERLTEHHVNKAYGSYMVCSGACINEDSDCNDCGKLAEMVDRLAAYEDTSLEPEATVQLKKIAEIFNCDPSDLEQLKAFYDKLRSQVTPNDPLTVEQLREMNGEPVWVEFLGVDAQPGWYLISPVGWEVVNWYGGFVLMEFYGKTWIAYRRKPKETSHD